MALSNVLERPIHVYELATVAPDSPTLHRATGCGTAGFVLRRMACFGSPQFDEQQALHILSADSRFPGLLPGEQLEAGNHFLAVFPVNDDEDDDDNERRGRKRLRGGDALVRAVGNEGDEADEPQFLVEHTISKQPLLKRAASKCIQWWISTFQN